MVDLKVRRGAIAGVVVAMIAASGTAARADDPVKTFIVLAIVGLVAVAAVVALIGQINRP